MEVSRSERYASGGEGAEMVAHNLGLAFQATVERQGDQVAVRAGDAELTWNEVRARASAAAGGLASLGVGSLFDTGDEHRQAASGLAGKPSRVAGLGVAEGQREPEQRNQGEGCDRGVEHDRAVQRSDGVGVFRQGIERQGRGGVGSRSRADR